MIPREGGRQKKENTNRYVFFVVFFVGPPPPEPFTFKDVYLYSAMALGRSLVFFKTMPDMRTIIKTTAAVSETSQNHSM